MVAALAAQGALHQLGLVLVAGGFEDAHLAGRVAGFVEDAEHRIAMDDQRREVGDGGRPVLLAAGAAAATAAASPALAQVDVGKASAMRQLVPAASLESSATKQYAQVLAEARAKGALAPEHYPQLKRLRAIAARLIPYAGQWNPRAKGWQWEVNLIGSKQINAWCMPGGKIAFYTGILDQLKLTENVAQVFMGMRIQCAQCHNHPFDKWTQMDYYQMAAHTYGMTGTNGLSNPLLANVFGGGYGDKGSKTKSKKSKTADIAAMIPKGVERKDMSKAMNEILRPLRYNTVLDRTDSKALALPHDYQYSDAKPKSIIEPVIPAAFSKDGKITKEGEKPVLAYSDWMTSKDNPRFTLVIANRLWKKAMGLGLIEPVDEITDSTVPSNPQLMSFLEQTMKDLNYDMKAYLRMLLNTQAFARASEKEAPPGVPYYFQGPVFRRMTAEQVWDSMVALVSPDPEQPNWSARERERRELKNRHNLAKMLDKTEPELLFEAAKLVAAAMKAWAISCCSASGRPLSRRPKHTFWSTVSQGKSV